jgi:uncharacterized glyoxalase superfamily protein PhnB
LRKPPTGREVGASGPNDPTSEPTLTPSIRLAAPIPVFRIFDEAKAREFYVDFLDFKVDWEHRFEEGTPIYMQISRDGCVLHLSEHHGDATPGGAVRIDADGLDELQHALNEKRYKYARPGIQEMPWGTRDMTIKDPFGNRLTFGTRGSGE